jgi:hypothetical protein
VTHRNRSLLDPIALQKSRDRAGFQLRKLRRRLAALEQQWSDEARSQTEQSPHEGDHHVARSSADSA